MKSCSKCKHTKENNNFCRDNKSKDKLQSVCKSCKSKQLSKYYRENPEKLWKKEYDESDRIKGLKKYYKHRVHYNVSRLVRNGLKDSSKSKPTFELLGYTVQDLKNHLESLFTEGMNWDNYGKYGWHIDHIIPRSKLIYDSENHPNFKICWSLNNLQPLWRTDNLKKGNR